MMKKRFVAYVWLNGFDHISLGLHFDWNKPNIEIHIPFGFIRIGWVATLPDYKSNKYAYRGYGYGL